MHQHPNAVASGDVIVHRLGSFPKDAIIALCPANGGTMVYVENREYSLRVLPEDLLNELGGVEKFCKVEGVPHRSDLCWFKRRAVTGVDYTNLAAKEISVFLLGRIHPFKYYDIDIREIYRQIGWIP